MNNIKIEDLEIKLLIEAIESQYGYDLSHYAPASLKRRVNLFLSKTDYKNPSEAISRLLHDKAFFQSFIFTVSITVTEMFRDPFVYQVIKDKVFPFLKTYPHLKIWHAGCATGEEVYAMAILLKEDGLYERTQIYASDFNDIALSKAKEGIYQANNIKEYIQNYQKAGGKASLSDYYHAKYDSVIMSQELKKNIVFANHNLVSDSVFGEMNLIMCRNVLIYFDRTLQNRVLRLFYDSLAPNGFLCLGTKESIDFSDVSGKFKKIAKKEKIYQVA